MKHAKLVTKVKEFDGSQTELARATFLLVYLQTGSTSLAAKHSGLQPRELKKIIELLAAHGSLSDSPRSGRPIVYTPDKMDIAFQLLVDNDEGSMTGQDLMGKLVDQGVLPHNADVDTFLHHFRQHVEANGHKLILNSTKTIFYIAVNDVVQRVHYAQHMMDALKTQPLDMIIFVDETTLEESPHPKGMTMHYNNHALWQHMQACDAWLSTHSMQPQCTMDTRHMHNCP